MQTAMGVGMWWIMVAMGCLTPWAVDPAQAQEAQPVRIVLHDGSQLIGTILEETDDAVRFRTASGVEMTIPKDQIDRTVRLQGSLTGGRLRRLDPNGSRLFFAPTARSLGHGQGYVALYELFFPFASVGIGDVAALGGGVTLFPSEEQLLYGAAKLTFVERRNLALAAGAFVLTFTGSEGAGGFLLGVGTFGPPDRSLTLGLGFGFGGGEFEETPVILVGGEVQTSNHLKLITENYIIPNLEDGVAFSGGLRFFGERFAADIALVTVVDAFKDGGFPFVPWLGVAYNFGSRTPRR